MFNSSNNQEEKIKDAWSFFHSKLGSDTNATIINPMAMAKNLYSQLVTQMGPKKAQEYFWATSVETLRKYDFSDRLSTPSTVLSEEEFFKLLNQKCKDAETEVEKNPKFKEEVAIYHELAKRVEDHYLNNDKDSNQDEVDNNTKTNYRP